MTGIMKSKSLQIFIMDEIFVFFLYFDLYILDSIIDFSIIKINEKRLSLLYKRIYQINRLLEKSFGYSRLIFIMKKLKAFLRYINFKKKG